METTKPKRVVFDAKLAEEQEYWRHQLKDIVSLTHLRPDHEIAPDYAVSHATDESPQDYVELAFDDELYAKLVGFAKGKPFLLFTLLVAGLKLTLHRYSGARCILVGSPALLESRTANAITLVSPIEGAQTFRQFVSQVRQTLADAYRRQSYPFSRVLKDIDLKIDDHRTLFDTVATMSGLHGEVPQLNQNLTIAFLPKTEGLSARFYFKSSLYKKESIVRFVDHYLQMLRGCLSSMDRQIDQYSMITPSERKLLVDDAQLNVVTYPRQLSVHQLFEKQVERTPDRSAAVAAGVSLSYRQLNAKANQLAHYMRSVGVDRGTVVGIGLPRSLDMLVAVLAVLKSGAAYLPLDMQYPLARIRYIAEKSDLQWVLCHGPADQQGANFSLLTDQMIDVRDPQLDRQSTENLEVLGSPQDTAYIIYTSGSTGEPKGVDVPHQGVVNYLCWAKNHYVRGNRYDFPLFSPLTFDLTVTSIYVPLISGGKIIVYGEQSVAEEIVLLKVLEDDQVDVIKLTPSHLQLLNESQLKPTRLKKMILGGEDLSVDLARSTTERFDQNIEIYNEYGPSEAVVGCMTYLFDPNEETGASVPIGSAIDNVQIYVLDTLLNPVPFGVIGEMYIGGECLAKGYHNRSDLTSERFIPNPFNSGTTLYRTGDYARWQSTQRLEFLGRRDEMVKIRGARIELGEIASRLLAHDDIKMCFVDVVQQGRKIDQSRQLDYCARCAMPSNYPEVSFNSDGVCNFCQKFDLHADRVATYFRSHSELVDLLTNQQSPPGEYDCMMLFSGGKDSTYALCQLVAMNLKVLAFTLDNGYISEDTKSNIRRIVEHIGVDHMFGSTPAMNSIFVDSLKRFSNVCNGCFKTIYTLSANVARQKNIKYVVTGLSRGQLFETRFSELFDNGVFDVDEVEDTIMQSRKAYHRMKDVVAKSLDVSIFANDTIFDQIKFIDFYRYVDVTLDEVFAYLNTAVPWVRPRDTGRSTNCLINEVGIYIHKEVRGHHNYALPYCWDVRLGHKTREAAIDELNEVINVDAVKGILTEIGFEYSEQEDRPDDNLIAYYVSEKRFSVAELRAFLGVSLPPYMVPPYFVRLEKMPLTSNGKVDRKALPKPSGKRPELTSDFVAPKSMTEKVLADIWTQLLGIDQVGVHDDFFDLGGHSLLAMRVMSRARDALHVDFPFRRLFELPTIAKLAEVIDADSQEHSANVKNTPIRRLSRSSQHAEPPSGDSTPQTSIVGVNE